MSTTIKPLDIYIGDVKVFPDVDLSSIGNPIMSSSFITELAETADDILEEQSCRIANEYANKAVIVPPIDDTQGNWHTHQSQIEKNYWNFSNYSTDCIVYDIMTEIDAAWLYCAFANSHGRNFWGYQGTEITFKEGSTMIMSELLYNDNDTPVTAYKNNWCDSMFRECKNLQAVYNLDLTGTASFNTVTDLQQVSLYDKLNNDSLNEPTILWSGYECMFFECNSLTTLDVTWPTVLYSCDFENMFGGCHNLPENQLGQLNLAPTNVIYNGGSKNTININNMFNQCFLFTTSHITPESWAYVRTARQTWNNTGLKSIDIPATATNLIDINGVVTAPPVWDPPVDDQNNIDYSDYKIIIRTTAPMTAYKNSTPETDILIMNFWDYDNEHNPHYQEFISTFGGIYVPDSQLSDWKTYALTLTSDTTMVDAIFHGVSDLSE